MTIIELEEMADVINHTAYMVWRRHKQHTDAEDIRQEMWTWTVAQDPKKLKALDERQLMWRLRDAGEVYARKERAAARGYKPEDEVFYSIATLRELLPLAVDTTPIVLKRDGENVKRSSSDPAGMEFETAIADIRKAYWRLSSKYRLALADAVENPDSVDDVVVTRALRFMQRKLGGRRPRRVTL